MNMPRTLGSPLDRAVCDFIVAKRKKSGLTQHELAAKLRRSQSYIARIETYQPVSARELVALGRVLDFDLHEVARMVAKLRR
jgi:ribosome-binding protein aMBF1 (putative translation factor)